jgi:hypothetical protein
MNKHVKAAALLAILIAAPTVAQAAGASVGRFQHATRAAVCGPPWNNAALWLFGGEDNIHHFYVGEAGRLLSVDKSMLWVTGNIEHLQFFVDDEFYYTITYEGAGNGLWKLKEVKTRIDRGGWKPLFGPIFALANVFVVADGGKPIAVTPEMVDKNTVDAAALIGGDWEDVVTILTANIAIAASNPNFCGIRVEKPTVDGFRLDWCRWWSKDCGKPAADAYCVSKGYSRSSHWEIDQHIGAVTPTKILETGDICAESFCDGFKFIECQ